MKKYKSKDLVVVENRFLGDKDITTSTAKYASEKAEAEIYQLLSKLKKQDADEQKQSLN
ncbi:hypothetical protein QCJ92_00011855 [Enterobacter roggenkampii]|uniref:hypothetical protein n=1 Tax=Enterobacter roggenkampii TaxID=1812935 RepID=UPI003022C911|nr:hypothetical protein [Enterobacter roggenkampii]